MRHVHAKNPHLHLTNEIKIVFVNSINNYFRYSGFYTFWALTVWPCSHIPSILYWHHFKHKIGEELSLNSLISDGPVAFAWAIEAASRVLCVPPVPFIALLLVGPYLVTLKVLERDIPKVLSGQVGKKPLFW